MKGHIQIQRVKVWEIGLGLKMGHFPVKNGMVSLEQRGTVPS